MPSDVHNKGIFNTARLQLPYYDFEDKFSIMALQSTAFQVMKWVRNGEVTECDLQAFIALMNTAVTFQLCKEMVPEFRRDRSYDPGGNSQLAKVLRALKHRRPDPPRLVRIPTSKDVHLRERQMEYLKAGGQFRMRPDAEERKRNSRNCGGDFVVSIAWSLSTLRLFSNP
ncbi:MAG: hypothetical protein Q9187_004083 [Circinaria calcarea]